MPQSSPGKREDLGFSVDVPAVWICQVTAPWRDWMDPKTHSTPMSDVVSILFLRRLSILFENVSNLLFLNLILFRGVNISKNKVLIK